MRESRYPADLFMASSDDLEALGLFRDGRDRGTEGASDPGQIRDREGFRVCAYSGRAYEGYLRRIRRRVAGGWVIDWCDRRTWELVHARRDDLRDAFRDLVQVAGERKLGEFIEKISGEVL